MNYDNGQVIKLAVSQADVAILRLLCGANPSMPNKSAAIPLIFDTSGNRLSSAASLLELLLTGGVEEESAMQALQIAIKGGSDNINLIDRLVAADARLIGHAFDCVMLLDNARHKEVILRFLLNKGISQETLDQALVIESQRAVEMNDTTIMKLFLEHGASINYDSGKALVNATSVGNGSLVTLLLNGRDTPSQATATHAFQALFDPANLRQPKSINPSSDNAGGKMCGQISGNYTDIANKLLVRGVDQHAIDMALRAVLDPENGLEDIETLVDRLLSYRAEVNAGNGVCFILAARRSSMLFSKLLLHQPHFTTLIPSLIESNFEEKNLVQLLETCFEHGCTADDLDLSRPPSLILAVQRYPRSEALAKILLDHGCNPDGSVPGIIDHASGEESTHILLWALAQPQKFVSSAVVLTLLNSGASATRVAPVSEIAPIAVAAREGRADIVNALLEKGADASIRDNRNRSALFYASSSSVTSVVDALTPHALKNDGSLHEAVRSLQLDAASTLIKFGHSPSFASRLHGGRDALGELCLNGELNTSVQRSTARRLLRLLLDNGARPDFRSRNERSAVILALDNPYNPLTMADMLLETEVWEQLNDEKHMFHDPVKGLWYSPLSYVEQISSPARTAQKQELLGKSPPSVQNSVNLECKCVYASPVYAHYCQLEVVLNIPYLTSCRSSS